MFSFLFNVFSLFMFPSSLSVCCLYLFMFVFMFFTEVRGLVQIIRGGSWAGYPVFLLLFVVLRVLCFLLCLFMLFYCYVFA